jgi:hypothetical protein
MDVQLLTQADFTLNKCGRPVAPGGLSVVYIPKSFLVQQYFSVSPTTPQQTLMKEITGDAPWCLRSMSATSSATTALSVQVQLPNGRFLNNNLADVLQTAGYGSFRYLFSKELECPVGSKIQVTFADTNTAVAQPMAILFEGAYKYLLKGGTGGLCSSQDAAASMPRYLRNYNENIMAPCWQQGVGPATPQGFQDQQWFYRATGDATTAAGVSLTSAIAIPLAGPFTAVQQIPIDMDSPFRCRRLLFNVQADATVTAGTLLGRVRTGSGYALCDDFFDLATYIGSAPMPKDWEIDAGDSVYIDLQLVDQVGTGSIYLQTFLEGVKRFQI